MTKVKVWKLRVDSRVNGIQSEFGTGFKYTDGELRIESLRYNMRAFVDVENNQLR